MASCGYVRSYVAILQQLAIATLLAGYRTLYGHEIILWLYMHSQLERCLVAIMHVLHDENCVRFSLLIKCVGFDERQF